MFQVKIPEWADIVKTSVAKELAPYDEDWYYTRCASVARHIYVRSPVGVKTITKIYGGNEVVQSPCPLCLCLPRQCTLSSYVIGENL